MVNICIYAYNLEQAEELEKLITEYIHCPPKHKMQGKNEYVLPLIRITITFGCTRGYKYDMIYYDKRYDPQIVNEVIYPQCVYSKPRPLSMLLERLK